MVPSLAPILVAPRRGYCQSNLVGADVETNPFSVYIQHIRQLRETLVMTFLRSVYKYEIDILGSPTPNHLIDQKLHVLRTSVFVCSLESHNHQRSTIAFMRCAINFLNFLFGESWRRSSLALGTRASFSSSKLPSEFAQGSQAAGFSLGVSGVTSAVVGLAVGMSTGTISLDLSFLPLDISKRFPEMSTTAAVTSAARMSNFHFMAKSHVMLQANTKCSSWIFLEWFSC